MYIVYCINIQQWVRKQYILMFRLKRINQIMEKTLKCISSIIKLIYHIKKIKQMDYTTLVGMIFYPILVPHIINKEK